MMTGFSITPTDIITDSVQRVAPNAADERVQHLRVLVQRVTTDSLTFAEAFFRAHYEALWQQARSPEGDHYPSEEQFWEQALAIPRRSGFQHLARGRTLSTLQLPPADRSALTSIGVHRFDVILPALTKDPTLEAARTWIAAARTLPREQLRERVSQTLGRTTRPRSGSQRLQHYIINAMPDVACRELAIDFFKIGATYTETDNPIAIVIAAMQETLATWQGHAEPTMAQRDITEDQEAD